MSHNINTQDTYNENQVGPFMSDFMSYYEM